MPLMLVLEEVYWGSVIGQECACVCLMVGVYVVKL